MVSCGVYEEMLTSTSPTVPPFTYSNQCASTLLTAYIPVLVLGFSLQLLVACAFPLLQASVSYERIPLFVRKQLSGVVWPHYWTRELRPEEQQARRSLLSSDPWVLLKTKTVICFDILNNLLLMLTFGICSPVMAVLICCVVGVKMSVWTYLIGRFVGAMLETDQSKSDRGSRDEALAALAEVYISVYDVLRACFWQLLWCSALFFMFLCWDIATDEVGWLPSIWLPLTALCVPVVLYVLSRVHFAREQRQQLSAPFTQGDVKQLPPPLTDNPIHSEL